LSSDFFHRCLTRLSDFKHLQNCGLQDIIQELLACVQEESRTVVPLAAPGEVSSVAFHSSNPGGEKNHLRGFSVSHSVLIYSSGTIYQPFLCTRWKYYYPEMALILRDCTFVRRR